MLNIFRTYPHPLKQSHNLIVLPKLHKSESDLVNFIVQLGTKLNTKKGPQPPTTHQELFYMKERS